jgi:hypothetical protein
MLARTEQNEDFQIVERGYGCCHLFHHGFINVMAVKV